MHHKQDKTNICIRFGRNSSITYHEIFLYFFRSCLLKLFSFSVTTVGPLENLSANNHMQNICNMTSKTVCQICLIQIA